MLEIGERVRLDDGRVGVITNRAIGSTKRCYQYAVRVDDHAIWVATNYVRPLEDET